MFLHHILCIIFPEKCVKLYSINWANLIIWLPLHLEIFGNICIANVYEPVCDVMNFDVNLIFPTKPLLYLMKKSQQKLKYLVNKKSFKGEITRIFQHS